MPEKGESGLQEWNGQVMESYTSKLYWPGAFSIYDEMRRRDPTIRTIWNALILLARTASWYAEPGGATDGDKRAADFLNLAMDDMSHTSEDAVEDALSCVLFGWSWLELVYKRRDDGLVGWKKWAVRRQSSFHRWEIDRAGGVQGMVQRPAPDYQKRTIPIEKSLHFTSQRDGGNPEGFALLESLYEIWYYVKNYQIMQGIGWQRTFVGLPVFEYEEKPSADDKSVVERVGQGLTMDEKQYVSVPSGIKFRLESANNAGAEALLNTIKYYRLLMLQTLLADFIDLGTGQTGSWALGSDKSQLFLMAVDGFLDRIAGVVNRFGVARLMGYNPSLAVTGMPKVVHTKVEKPALGQLGNWLQQIGDKLSWRPEDEDWLRRRTGMPTISADADSSANSDRNQNLQVDEQEELAEFQEGEPDGRGDAESAVEVAVRQAFGDQAERVIEAQASGEGNVGDNGDFWTAEDAVMRSELLGPLVSVLVRAVESAAIEMGVDWTEINADALAWAREYTYDLITGLNETTLRNVREAVAAWIETGGELGELEALLEPVFGANRAQMIAITEVTRVFSEANNLVFQAAGLPEAIFRPPAHVRCRCWLRPERLPNGEWVIVWQTASDERVSQVPVATPWGALSDRDLQGVVVSANYGGMTLSAARAMVGNA